MKTLLPYYFKTCFISISFFKSSRYAPCVFFFARIYTYTSQIFLVAQIMPQFSGAPVEFMTSDDIECKRGDGWFLSYTKIAGIVVVFIIGVVAAGFLGWYINSLPKKKVSNMVKKRNRNISPLIHLRLENKLKMIQ